MRRALCARCLTVALPVCLFFCLSACLSVWRQTEYDKRFGGTQNTTNTLRTPSVCCSVCLSVCLFGRAGGVEGGQTEHDEQSALAVCQSVALSVCLFGRGAGASTTSTLRSLSALLCLSVGGGQGWQTKCDRRFALTVCLCSVCLSICLAGGLGGGRRSTTNALRSSSVCCLARLSVWSSVRRGVRRLSATRALRSLSVCRSVCLFGRGCVGRQCDKRSALTVFLLLCLSARGANRLRQTLSVHCLPLVLSVCLSRLSVRLAVCLSWPQRAHARRSALELSHFCAKHWGPASGPRKCTETRARRVMPDCSRLAREVRKRGRASVQKRNLPRDPKAGPGISHGV